ncbi:MULTISPECIES: hypothetical protein [Brevibacterium]|uniref:hypothetical protein n=1 Tax=Brevibacterium TaxID=1696 RepID=UPI001C24B551|nr:MULTISPECIES: hypothetical protein [Brevibacterium]MBU8578889.1 hypothetical protein [Brevibacterium luteolum]MCT1690751.1 hypothetical protein [Brevibacterium sp. p3-SID960]
MVDSQHFTDAAADNSRLAPKLDDELAWLVITGSGFSSTCTGLSADQVEEIRADFLASLHCDGFTSQYERTRRNRAPAAIDFTGVR